MGWTKFRVKRMQPKIDPHQKAYVCLHVFRGERPVLLVSRPDGDWCFLCGDAHENDASAYRVVGIGHVLDRDQELRQALDLPPDWDAERGAVGQPWERRPIDETS